MYEPKKINCDVYLLTNLDMEEQISNHWSPGVSFKIEPNYEDRTEWLGFICAEELDEWDNQTIFSAIEQGYYAYCPYLFIQQLINDGVFPSGYYVIDLAW